MISICILFAIVYLYTNNYWTFAQAYFVNVGYDSLLIVSLLAILIIDIIAIARQRLSVKTEDINESFQDDQKGYCMEEVYTKHRETGWGSYVEDLLALMPRERLKKESLAIGISGKWGSGKTSFLKTMMESMKDDYLEISFNPWKCTDKVQIVSQFFTLMRKELDGMISLWRKQFKSIVISFYMQTFIQFLPYWLKFFQNIKMRKRWSR